jgi:hypothetical protein
VWENFYLITGPSAAVLIGLQFVVIALVADVGAGTTVSISAFGTPIILHFCTVFLVAGVLMAPWATYTGPALIIGLCGVAGVTYMMLAVRRARRQSTYHPVLEDWVWYTGVPLAAYVALIVGAIVLAGHARAALFVVGAAVLVLLFLGIRNAWDTVVYIAVSRREGDAGTVGEQTDAASASSEGSR